MFAEYFKGKSAIVTGAGRGMGRAIATKLDQLGTKVYAVSNDPENLETLKEECPNVTTIFVDLVDWEATRIALEPLPVVDMLVNNAGIAVPAKFQDIKPEDVDMLYKVNFKAIINVSQLFAKKLVAVGKGGSIVNTSSSFSVKSCSLFTAYSALKAATDNLTRCMAIELAPLNIRVNAINPGPVATALLVNCQKLQEEKYGSVGLDEMDKMINRIPSPNKMVDIGDVVNTVIFLLSDAATSVVGNITLVDGGLSIA